MVEKNLNNDERSPGHEPEKNEVSFYVKDNNLGSKERHQRQIYGVRPDSLVLFHPPCTPTLIGYQAPKDQVAKYL